MRERATKEESECVRKKTQHTELYKLDESHWPRISIRTHVLFSNTNMLFGSEIATHREIRGFPPTAERLAMVIYLEISQHYWIYIAMHTLRAQRTSPSRDCGESSSLLLSTSHFPPPIADSSQLCVQNSLNMNSVTWGCSQCTESGFRCGLELSTLVSEWEWRLGRGGSETGSHSFAARLMKILDFRFS